MTLLIAGEYDVTFSLAVAATLAASTTSLMVRSSGLMAGYYLWLGSFLAFTACAYVAGEGARDIEGRSGRPDDRA